MDNKHSKCIDNFGAALHYIHSCNHTYTITLFLSMTVQTDVKIRLPSQKSSNFQYIHTVALRMR